MAQKLNDKPSASVHQLPTRKARGAGGQKRKGPSTGRAKPRPGESKPAPRAANEQPSDEDVRRNNQDRLVALHQRHRSLEGKMAAAAEVSSGLKTEKALIRASIQTIVPLSIYEELHGKVTKKTERSDNELYEKQRAMAFEAFGLPCGPTAELDFKGVPEAARPALHWETFGYQQGIDGQFLDPVRDHVPPENLQDYMRGGEMAVTRNGRGIKLLKEAPVKAPAAPSAPPAVGPEAEVAGEDALAGAEAEAMQEGGAEALAKPDGSQPDWSGYPDHPDLFTEDHWKEFRAWYYGLAPDAEVNLDHPGVEKAFDLEFIIDSKRKDEPAFSEDV